MPKLGRIGVVRVGFEYPARRPAIHRYEPGSDAELGSSPRHGTDVAAIAAAPMYEVDGPKHAHLAFENRRDPTEGGASKNGCRLGYDPAGSSERGAARGHRCGPAQCGPGDPGDRAAPRTISARSSVHPPSW
jgi:hypothetical protein